MKDISEACSVPRYAENKTATITRMQHQSQDRHSKRMLDEIGVEKRSRARYAINIPLQTSK